jgi:hypothetical protein
MSPRVIRYLVLAALAFPAAVLLTPARAQFGPPGGPPPGMGGMPGGGMPGAFQGGMAGQPGGMGGMGGGAMDEWVCSRCGGVIGHGPKPGWMICPKCGARFSDGPGDPDPGPPALPHNAAPPAANNPPATGSNRTVLMVITLGVGALIVLGAVGAAVYYGATRGARKDAPRRRPRRSAPRRASASQFPDEE